jgi:long-subunit fatty acid transport protein
VRDSVGVSGGVGVGEPTVGADADGRDPGDRANLTPKRCRPRIVRITSRFFMRSRRPGGGRILRLLGPLLCALCAARPFAVAHGAPLDDPHIGGFTFSGPTSGTLAAVYWNPAALGLVRGLQVTIAGTMRVARTKVDLAPIDAGSAPPGSVSATDTTDPRQWPTGPGGFFGISTDFGGDRFTLAFASYSPFVDQGHFGANAAGDEPTRYFRLDADLRHLALVPALAVRIGSELRVGVAPGFLFSTGRLSFAEDTGDGTGRDPTAAARYDVASGQSITDSRVSFTLGLGAYYRKKAFEFGLAYSSRPFGTDVAGIEIGAPQTTVTKPDGTPVTCASGGSDRCVFGDIVYKLPDVWTAGITWHARPGLEVSLIERWIWFHVQDRIDIRLTSPGLQAASLPDHIVFHRGFHDVWDTRLRVAYWLREGLRIGAGLRVETSAVDAADVNPAAVDGLKLEPMVLMEARLTRRLALAAGYGFTYMPTVTVYKSSFDPQAATRCAGPDVNQDLNDPSCIARRDGRARPSAAGTYARTVHDFSLSLTAYF